MKIERKKGVKKWRIVEHNKILLYWIIALTVILIFVIYGIIKLNNEPASGGIVILQNASIECNSDSDCVPSSCCHATSCVAKSKVPTCKNIACTLNCEPNTMDCGQGSCSCVQGKCSVKWSQ